MGETLFLCYMMQKHLQKEEWIMKPRHRPDKLPNITLIIIWNLRVIALLDFVPLDL